jgi:hypothetical protein
MNPTVQLDPRPEAMSDVPGVCELPLTRALVQYRDVHETALAGGRIQDIGIALVLEGRYASSADALDLGSADVKVLDLSAELVVLDWAYEPTLEHARALLREAIASGDRGSLERFSFRLALRVLERLGFGPLTRPTLMRIGFRDICRDLDLHEGTSVRIVMGSGRIARAHLDYDGNALVFRTATSERDPVLESALERCFPSGDLRRLLAVSESASGGYQVRLPLPLSVDEVRQEMSRVRDGLGRLIGLFEPERRSSLERLTDTFGSRETLAHLNVRPPVTVTATLADDLPAPPPAALAHAAGALRPPQTSEGQAFGSAAVH